MVVIIGIIVVSHFDALEHIIEHHVEVYEHPVDDHELHVTELVTIDKLEISQRSAEAHEGSGDAHECDDIS